MFEFIINHFISNIPIWVWPMGVGASVAVYLLSYLLSMLPQIKPLAYIIKPLCVIVCFACVFMWGGAGVTAIWQAQIKEAQAKIDAAVVASKAANDKLTQVRKQKNQVIVQRQVVIQERIKTVEKRIDAECKVDPAAIQILNDSATNPEAKKK